MDSQDWTCCSKLATKVTYKSRACSQPGWDVCVLRVHGTARWEAESGECAPFCWSSQSGWG